jgi:hypothetical protein
MITAILGWSAGMNKWRDPTGRAHLQVERDGDGMAVNACGSRAMTYAVTTATPEDAGAHACARCRAIVRSRRSACPP